ncbi:C40 family peptidase [Microbispora hainanensis]|uniref:NlpC/P60 family protein n=1 Tax=Microbispora hainanensis TaxID=568844 RepID=A0A544Z3F1_9ACTN|nr:C40 family peptidase [Microbispora hainanensis]TQS23577.1 NlpC/P60 family protein [Microbispora hainanensis]
MRGRVPVAAGLAAVVLLTPMTGAQADPKPTVAQAKAKLSKLNAQADQLVDRYNAANEKWKKARQKYLTINEDYKKQNARVESLRSGLVSMAVSSYQVGDMGSWGGVFYSSNPDAMLSGLATLNHMSAERAGRLKQYEGAIKDLKDRRNQSKAVYQEAADVKDELADEKEKVDKLVREQMKLLRSLGTFNPGNPNSAGVVYNGPASGNALAALQFAYKQIGKPYRYGGTGPGAWDCSGLVQAAWEAAGVRLPRTSYEQWAWGASRRVSLDDLQPGDLLWHAGYGHVGIYAGDGKVVHAPQTGDVVKVVTLAEYHAIGAVRP